MAFDEGLAQRVREHLESSAGARRARGALDERRMFGGLAFLLGGHMCCGVVGGDLMVRVGPEAYADALAEPHAREMDFTGRPMKGLVFVSADGIAEDEPLRDWIERGVRFAASLPPKA